jgi:hypothetical protein
LASIVSAGRAHDQSIALARDPNIYEKMRLDATVAHLVQVRKHMIAGSRWQLAPASSSDIDKKAAEVMERILDIGLKRFATSRFDLAEAVFTGSAFARITGNLHWLTIFDGIPRQFWLPEELVDVDRRRFDKLFLTKHDPITNEPRIEVEWRMFDYLRNQWVIWDHPEWYVKNIYNDHEETLGYGSGLIDSMYFYWRAKEILWRSGLQGAERWALGFMVAKVDNARDASSGKTNQSIVNSFMTELEKQRSQHYFIMDKVDELEVLPGPGQGSEIVERLIQYCDRQLRLLVLGSNLPTEATGGGSYNLAEVQQGTTDTLIKYDRSLVAEALTVDLLTLTWNINRPALVSLGLGNAEMPKLAILDEKRSDPKIMAEVTKTILDAGIALKADEVYELLGRTQPGPGDEVIEAMPQMPSFGPDGEPLDQNGELPDDVADPSKMPKEVQGGGPGQSSMTSAAEKVLEAKIEAMVSRAITKAVRRVSYRKR